MSKKWFNIFSITFILFWAITPWLLTSSFGADLLPEGRGMIDMGPLPDDPSVIENLGLTNQSTSKITVQDFSRYSAEVGEQWQPLDDGKAYFRDVFVGLNNNVKFISPVIHREDDPNIDATLKNAVCDKGPQIIHTKNSGHFVVASGRDMNETTWEISDPDGGNYTTLADVAEYNNTYQSVRKFGGPEYYYPYLQYMQICLYPYNSPGELVLIDPEGRKTGYDPVAGVKYREIPNASYGIEGLDDHGTGAPGPRSMVISIGRPMAGGYDPMSLT